MRTCKLILASVIFLCSFGYSYSQTTPRKVSLVVAECVKGEGVCYTKQLVRYKFQNGKLIEREIVVSIDDKSDVRFDLGENRIYQNRYVITEWADVVDIQEKKVIHKGKGEYLGVEGDKVYEFVNRGGVEGYYSYDLKTYKYEWLKNPGKWQIVKTSAYGYDGGVLSPDGTKGVAGKRGSSLLWLIYPNGEKSLLGSDFRVELDFIASTFPKAPAFWIDNERVITQKQNGELVTVHTATKKITPVVNIPIKELEVSDPFFFRNSKGQLIYSCSSEYFVIDIEKKTYVPYKWIELDNGFTGENERNKDYGHIIRYKGEEIGRFWCSVWGAKTVKDYIVFEYGKVGSNLGYPDGLKVWSSESREWTTLNEGWGWNIIGWIEE